MTYEAGFVREANNFSLPQMHQIGVLAACFPGHLIHGREAALVEIMVPQDEIDRDLERCEKAQVVAEVHGICDHVFDVVARSTAYLKDAQLPEQYVTEISRKIDLALRDARRHLK